MSGNQSPPPYLLPPPPNYKKPWRERLDDQLEGFFTGDSRGYSLRYWLWSLFVSLGLSILTVAAFILFEPSRGLVSTNYGGWVNWAYQTDNPFFSVMGSAIGFGFRLLDNIQWILVVWVVLGGTITVRTVVYGVPHYYRTRKADREDAIQQQKELSKQAAAQAHLRETAQQKAREAERQNREREAQVQAERQTVERDKRMAAWMDLMDRRAAARKEIEDSINVSIGREIVSCMTQKNTNEDTPYLRVRARLKATKLPPEYGLLHEAKTEGVLRVLGGDRSWLPPPPPLPGGVASGSTAQIG